MSRRSFLKWLLLMAASLIGVSAAAAKWFKNKLLPEEASFAAPSPAESVRPNLSPASKDAAISAADPLLSYFILSDLHVTQGESSTTAAKTKLAMEDLKTFDSQVEALMLTGDLTDSGTEAEYKVLRKILNGYKLPPVHGNMGNHDYYTIWINKNDAWDQENKPNGKSDALSRQQFMKFFGYKKLYNEYTAGGYTIFLLSQEAYVQEKPEVGEGAWYSDEQLNWLKDRLAAVYEPGKPVFIMTHQPLPPAGTNGGSHQLIRAKEFREILKPYKNVFVFCGHRHQDFQNGTQHYFKETFHYFHNSSVGKASNRSFQQNQSKAQGLYVQVFQDKVVLRGREFTNKTFIAEADWTVKLEKA